MLVIRRQQLAALRPELERHFASRLCNWAEARHPELVSMAGRSALEDRIAGCMVRARRYAFRSRRDVALFVDMDLRLGPMFEDAPGNEWMKTLLGSTGLTPATRLFRIECRLERLAALSQVRAQEEINASAT